MAERIPKLVTVALADDLRIVLAHLCEGYLDAANRAFTESVDELTDLKRKRSAEALKKTVTDIYRYVYEDLEG
jgi:hypothetical protein